MEHHALTFLNEARHWGWPPLHCLRNLAYPMHRDGTFALKLLIYGVIESNRLQGSFMDEFWGALSRCHPRIEENVVYLIVHASSIEPQQTMKYIMRNVGSSRIDHSHLDRLAGQVLRHLVIPFMHIPANDHQHALPLETVAALQSKGCGSLTEAFFDEGTPIFLKEELLKLLLRRRDGRICLITGCRFKLHWEDESKSDGVDPELVYLIPEVFSMKPEYMEFLEKFVSPAIYQTVQLHIRGPGNAMFLQKHARLAFENFIWGIELKEAVEKPWLWFYEDLCQLRKNESVNDPSSGLIDLYHGDEICFGCGSDGAKLRYGPTPSVCLLRRSVGHLIKLTGADQLIHDMRAEADCRGFPVSMLKPDEFISILTAKLLLLV